MRPSPVNTAESHLVVEDDEYYWNRCIDLELLRQLIVPATDRGHEVLTLTVVVDNGRAITVYDNI